MFLAYERKRSTTSVGRVPAPEFDQVYHCFHRGWLLHAIKRKAIVEFRNAPFSTSPFLYPADIGSSSSPYYYADGETRMCWFCGSRIYLGCGCCRKVRRLIDEWSGQITFGDTGGCVMLDFNNARGIRLSCCFSRAELYDQIEGATEIKHAGRLVHIRTVARNADKPAVEVIFGFGADFKRADYAKLEEMVFASLQKILSLLESCAKRAKRSD